MIDLYTLDENFRRQEIVDGYFSLVWTERFCSSGDVLIDLPITDTNRELFKPGLFLAQKDSHRVQVIETVEEKTNEDGAQILTASGRTLEKILECRLAKPNWNNTTVSKSWSLTGKPGDIARYIFEQICIIGVLDAKDIIPFIRTGNILPLDTIEEPQTLTTLELPFDTVYKTIQSICETYDLGFRIIRNYDTSELYFNVYSGINRTTDQTLVEPVVFSAELGNLSSTSSLTSTATHKNVAYVISPLGVAIVYGFGVDPDVAGFDRKVEVVKLDDLTSTTMPPATVAAVLKNRGIQALVKARRLNAFDGELDVFSSYVYGKDYALGDLVELTKKDGSISRMRVTEQIFVSDFEGTRSYPTLSLNSFIEPGTWKSYKDSPIAWFDKGDAEFWSNQ